MLTVAVIDNDPDVLRMVERMLTESDYKCLSFRVGTDALAVMADTAVDLVITDIYMPHMDGFAVLDQVTSMFPDLPVVAMSGGGRLIKVDMLPEARRAGARAILDKPFTRAQLLAAISQALSKGEPPPLTLRPID